MKRSSLSLALSLLLVFGSGIAVGVFGHGYYESASAAKPAGPQTPEEFRRGYIDEMTARLSLSPDQAGKLNEILDQTRAHFRELRERHKPETKAIQDEQVNQVNAMLSAPQQAEYAKMRAEREAKRKADEKGRGPKPTASSK